MPTKRNLVGGQWLFLVPIKGGRWHIIPQLAVYTTYILPSRGLYNPYHLLPEPEKSIEVVFPHPSEKYDRQIGNLPPNRDENKNI